MGLQLRRAVRAGAHVHLLLEPLDQIGAAQIDDHHLKAGTQLAPVSLPAVIPCSINPKPNQLSLWGYFATNPIPSVSRAVGKTHLSILIDQKVVRLEVPVCDAVLASPTKVQKRLDDSKVPLSRGPLLHSSCDSSCNKGYRKLRTAKGLQRWPLSEGPPTKKPAQWITTFQLARLAPAVFSWPCILPCPCLEKVKDFVDISGAQMNLYEA